MRAARFLVRALGALVALAAMAGLTATWIACGIPRDAENWAACIGIHSIAAMGLVVGALLWRLPHFLGEDT